MVQHERVAIGVWGAVPIALLQDSAVTLRMLKVYAALSSCQGASDKCWPSLDEIAERAGVHRTHVSGATRALEESGWIRKTGRQADNQTTVYVVLHGVAPVSQNGVQAISQIGVQAVRQSSYYGLYNKNKTRKQKGSADAQHPTLEVPMNQSRYDKLCQEHGSDVVDDAIQARLDWEATKGRAAAKDYASAAANWLRKDSQFQGGNPDFVAWDPDEYDRQKEREREQREGHG